MKDADIIKDMETIIAVKSKCKAVINTNSWLGFVTKPNCSSETHLSLQATGYQEY